MPQLQQLLAMLGSLKAVLPEGWLDRASKAVQQATQEQQGSGGKGVSAHAEEAAAAGQQLESCQQLISRLRELQQQQQQQQEGLDGDAGILGGTTLDISGDTVEVEVAG
jgi:small-conductance mechanosensitive channel